MALVMPLAGKLSDRHGGGPLALFGVILTTVTTIPFGFVGAHTSIAWLSVAMFAPRRRHRLRVHAGDGGRLRRARALELADATPQLNVLQRVGGSIGTATLAVVLQRALVGANARRQGVGLRDRVLVVGRNHRARDRAVHRPRCAPSARPAARAADSDAPAADAVAEAALA
jgi:MFS family permease